MMLLLLQLLHPISVSITIIIIIIYFLKEKIIRQTQQVMN